MYFYLSIKQFERKKKHKKNVQSELTKKKLLKNYLALHPYVCENILRIVT